MKYLFLIFVIFTSCTHKTVVPDAKVVTNKSENSEVIKSISKSTAGGQLGYAQTTKITADSVVIELTVGTDATKNRSKKIANTKYKLDKILNTNNLSEFSKLKNGPSRQPVDGSDTTIEIVTDKKKYSVTNAEGNSTFDTANAQLNKILSQEF